LHHFVVCSIESNSADVHRRSRARRSKLRWLNFGGAAPIMPSVQSRF
jgi:hypothetical protein